MGLKKEKIGEVFLVGHRVYITTHDALNTVEAREIKPVNDEGHKELFYNMECENE